MRKLLMTLSSVLIAATFAIPLASAATDTGFSIKYVSGGATARGREHMAKMAAEYDLQIAFKAPKEDQDYTDVRLGMIDSTGKSVLNAKAGGPLFYIQIPPGDYTVTANLGGKQLSQTTTVAPGHTSRLTFDWRT